MKTVHAGQTLIADPPGGVPSGQNRSLVARPFPIRSQPDAATRDPNHLSEPAPNRSQAAARQPRAGSLIIDSPFAAVPEWVIDAPISDTALRLYCVLLRYGNTTGHRMPSRATLAARLHKKSTDTIDRALSELEQLGALAVEHRATSTGRALTNRYHLLTARPGTDQAGARTPRRRGRTDTATDGTEEAQPPAPTPPPADRDGRTDAAPTGRTTAATVAAPIGQDRKPSTQTPPHPLREQRADPRRHRRTGRARRHGSPTARRLRDNRPARPDRATPRPPPTTCPPHHPLEPTTRPRRPRRRHHPPRLAPHPRHTSTAHHRRRPAHHQPHAPDRTRTLVEHPSGGPTVRSGAGTDCAPTRPGRRGTWRRPGPAAPERPAGPGIDISHGQLQVTSTGGRRRLGHPS